MSSRTASLGLNRTGAATAREAVDQMVQGTAEFPPEELGSGFEIAQLRQEYAKDAEPLGSVPPPVGLGGMVDAAIKGIKGAHPTQFIDKLGERLAFERTGVRLFEAMISKLPAFEEVSGGPTLADLEAILAEEHEHMLLVKNSLETLGGDPTVVTPSADTHATMTQGVLAVMVDPRTNLMQSLEALLVAELIDNEGWNVLVEMAAQSGEEELALAFARARDEEIEHLESVRAWLGLVQGRREVVEP